jgi:hypothetical protein
MFNEELYKELELRYGVERMMSFAEIMATRHELLFADSDEPLNGEDFERDWWLNKFAELSDNPEEPQTIEVVLAILKHKGYSSVLEVKNKNKFDDETLRIREDDQQRLQNLQGGQKQDLDQEQQRLG